ncbi:MAG: glycosyltransferase family 2 protein [Erysipelotrichaceae bacterium]|nr:glycosyltransferase family 2 protein [Erysipelotrichaceae bacterium]MCH4044069.1 glycosyltransferase family 2 protein [Erysipelotrichaceae bacterium]MCH4121284.1 glycosyltransferase family 2 protein [Erysipelotrichaceae bacterium]
MMKFNVHVKNSNIYQAGNSRYLFLQLEVESDEKYFVMHAEIDGEKYEPTELFEFADEIYSAWFYIRLSDQQYLHEIALISHCRNGSVKRDQLETTDIPVRSIIGDIYGVSEFKNYTQISGWSFSYLGGKKYSITDESGNEQKISVRNTVFQRTIESGITDTDNALSVGFLITFTPMKEAKYFLNIEDGASKLSIPVKKNMISEPGFSFVRLVKAMTKENIDKGVKYLHEYGFKGFGHKVLNARLEKFDYDAWFYRNRAQQIELEKERAHVFSYAPKISILVPTYNTPIDLFEEMIHSVLNQSYSNWELCIADASDKDNDIRLKLKQYQDSDPRIKVTFLSENKGISGNTNEALTLAAGEYTALFDHDDLLEPDCLYQIVKSVQNMHYDVLYTDEDKYNDDSGRYEDPNLKPDFDPDLFLSHNYITHFFAVKKEIIDAVGGFRPKFDGSQDYDVMLRCIEKSHDVYHIPKILYHWRMHEGSTALDPESKMYCYVAGKNALDEHFERTGINAKAEIMPKPYWGMYHIHYSTGNNPLISIIIPSCDHVDLLKNCIQSIINVSTYRNFEILIIENNSKNQDTFAYYDAVQKEHSNVHVYTWKSDGGFNYSAINNFGVEKAKGEYLLLLNNDTEMVSPDALTEMLGVCMREDVGCVGAKLLYKDDTVQHAGVVAGFSGFAGHVFTGIGKKDLGFMMRAMLNGDYCAVTGACLMTKKDIYQAVGGLDEDLRVAGNDIDYCLKVRSINKLVVYNAFALWHHYESKSRGYEDDFEHVQRFDHEIQIFQRKWHSLLSKGDPYYNKNFRIEDGPYILK